MCFILYFVYDFNTNSNNTYIVHHLLTYLLAYLLTYLLTSNKHLKLKNCNSTKQYTQFPSVL